MYFPYLRGRQYELLAIRELVSHDLLSDNIIPIIEPVKLSSTLAKTMETFIRKKHKLAIVCNPAVGYFNNDMKSEENDSGKKQFLELLKNEFIIKSHIIKSNSNKQISNWEAKMGVSKDEWIIINNNRDYIDLYNEIFSSINPKYVLIPDEFRRKFKNNKVLFEDKFKKQERNSDYSLIPDEFFSEDHIFYKEENFCGFADYSIIGKDFLDSGFAPYAVAIHIVYFGNDNSLRIHHFVSDSNDDIQNPAKKFYEAVSKLSNWVIENENNIKNTLGLSEFLEHFKNQTYPGLGSVKKLSLMHHLELIGTYLDEVK